MNIGPLGILGHNMKLLGLGALGEVGSLSFLSVPWDIGTGPFGGLRDCLDVLRNSLGHSFFIVK